MKPLTPNTLYYGDNLPILQQHFPDESVDLIYLDPPFNSNRSYNLLFKDEKGHAADAQITAFDDTWHWNFATEQVYLNLTTQSSEPVSKIINALRSFIGANQMMAYLVMMTARLVELHRVLKPTGSLYLHCDPTASHYLKLVLDAIFGVYSFQNEISWKRTSAHSDTKQGGVLHMGRIHDVIFYYTKTGAATRNEVYLPYSKEYINDFYRHYDPDGRRYRLGDLTGPGGATKGNPHYEFLGVTRYWRYKKERMEELYQQGRIIQTKPGAVPQYKRYLDEMPGIPLQDFWDDIAPIGAQASERLGYPTQKPLSLLERIISASSNPGDIVLDPFCGCGTAVAAAEKLGRQWVGIDITHLSISLITYRMREMFPAIKFSVVGEPEDYASACKLAYDDRYQFQWWALSLVKARPLGGDSSSREGRKGADKGIDGVIHVMDDNTYKLKTIIVQVKSGRVKSSDIRDLVGTIQRENAIIGVFITLEPPTQDMIREAAAAGIYESISWNRIMPRIQILSIEQLLAGAKVEMPPSYNTFKQSAPASKPDANQPTLDLGL